MKFFASWQGLNGLVSMVLFLMTVASQVRTEATPQLSQGTQEQYHCRQACPKMAARPGCHFETLQDSSDPCSCPKMVCTAQTDSQSSPPTNQGEKEEVYFSPPVAHSLKRPTSAGLVSSRSERFGRGGRKRSVG
ncbi:hypothetical protein IE53DRAFT_381848 [Violaceomyces palustris]|uniref:Uncharacterized protein n=1 Tax=Violaceomyces palustris TaxID=1673888 RepID=A0ACD0NPR8_9BASI|nr:hypothetical protein IE53DRAFT_381848 [Violaceomyces palustris]